VKARKEKKMPRKSVDLKKFREIIKNYEIQCLLWDVMDEIFEKNGEYLDVDILELLNKGIDSCEEE
jgi:hypothetical protein